MRGDTTFKVSKTPGRVTPIEVLLCLRGFTKSNRGVETEDRIFSEFGGFEHSFFLYLLKCGFFLESKKSKEDSL